MATVINYGDISPSTVAHYTRKLMEQAGFNVDAVVVDDPLYVCTNDVPDPTMHDPLCQRRCEECDAFYPHTDEDFLGISCYCPEVLDSMVGEAMHNSPRRPTLADYGKSFTVDESLLNKGWKNVQHVKASTGEKEAGDVLNYRRYGLLPTDS